MALSLQTLTAGGRDSIGNTGVTASITPVVGTLILAVAEASRGSTSIQSLSCVGCNIVWTQITAISNSFLGQRTSIFWGIVTPAATAGALTFTSTGSQGMNWAVYEFSAPGVVPIVGQSKTKFAATSVAAHGTITLDAVPRVSSSVLVAFGHSNSNNLRTYTPGAGFSTLHYLTVTAASSFDNALFTEVDHVNAAQIATCTISGTAGDGSIVAVEVQEPVGGWGIQR